MLLGPCLRVSQRVLFECFLAFLGPKITKKKLSKSTLSEPAPKVLKRHSVGHFLIKKTLRRIQKGFTAEPSRNDSGPNFQ